MIRCRFGGPAPCFDDLCHGTDQTLCGLDMNFEQEIEDEIYGRRDDDSDESDFDDYEDWLQARRMAAAKATDGG